MAAIGLIATKDEVVIVRNGNTSKTPHIQLHIGSIQIGDTQYKPIFVRDSHESALDTLCRKLKMPFAYMKYLLTAPDMPEVMQKGKWSSTLCVITAVAYTANSPHLNFIYKMFRNRLSQEIKQTTIHTDTVSPKALMSKKNYLTQSIKKTSKTACANSNSSHTKKNIVFICVCVEHKSNS